MDFYIASSNIQKCSEFRKMAPDVNILVSEGFDANETGTTYKENALIKVLTLQKFLRNKGVDTSSYVLFSDDSGLEISAMPSQLGLHTARFMPGATQAEKNKAIVEYIKTKNDKSARFICTICYIVKDSQPQYAIGEESGVINDKVLGLNGFGYDPVFIPLGQTKTYSELGEEYKNAHSHRSIAFSTMLAAIKSTHPDLVLSDK